MRYRFIVAWFCFWLTVPALAQAVERDADDAWRAGGPVELNRIGAAELLWKSDRGLIPLPSVGLEVELTVTGILLHGRISQTFHNPTGDVIEALYVFPLSDRAAVHGMEMHIGDRVIRSVIREREAARKAYEDAKAIGRKAALVDQQRPNLFSTTAASINPGESISVVLEYFDELEYDGRAFRLRFPLTTTPRFLPPEFETRGPRDRHLPASDPSVPSARVEVRLQPGLPLADLDSESHALATVETAGSYVVTTQPQRVLADRDFLLRWAPRLDVRPTPAVFTEYLPDGRYALFMLLPPIPESDAALGLPTETLFVIDVSGSMEGDSIRQARAALLAALDRLRPEDRFNILKFNDTQSAFRPVFRHAEPDELAQARDWVERLEAGGGTMILPALEYGLDLLEASSGSRGQRLVFLTDGAVGNESQVYDAIVRRLGTARLHAIGIGRAPNTYLMRKMASFGRGLCQFVASTSGAKNEIDRFFARLARPVMRDLELRWEGLEPDAVFPERPGDLHAGEPLLVYAKLPLDHDGRLGLGGYTREGWIETALAVDDDVTDGSGIAVRWGRARVASLMDSLHEGADPEDVRSEVIDLALSLNLVTRYTSLVAVEQIPTATGDSRLARLANGLPQGGTAGPLRWLLGWILTGIGVAALALSRK